MKSKKKFFFIIITVFICLALLISVLSGCGKKPAYEDIWEFCQSYIRGQLKEYSEYNLIFPEKYKEGISQTGDSKYEIKSYIIDYYKGCCGNYKRRDFTMVIDYENGNYTVQTFNLSD